VQAGGEGVKGAGARLTPQPTKEETNMTKTAQRTINRAFENIKKHPELGRVYKKDLVALENFESNGLVRNATVLDIFSGRTFACGQGPYSYYEAVEIEVGA
jgi:hypothetical protein